jgi:hypothetical protein
MFPKTSLTSLTSRFTAPAAGTPAGGASPASSGIGSRLNLGAITPIETLAGIGGAAGNISPALAGALGSPGSPASPASPGPAADLSGRLTTLPGSLAGDLVRPSLPPFNPPVVTDPFIGRTTGPQTATLLARSAIDNLEKASSQTIVDALNFIRNAPDASPAEALLDRLERQVAFNEVLAEMAAGWRDVTRNDFARSFSMPADRLDVMDAIVSLAVLNDPDLEHNLRAENTPATNQADLMSNRRVIYQYPPPGTVLEPPYIVLIAVEYTDPRPAQDVVQAILGSLAIFQNFKLPRRAAVFNG